MSENRLYHSIAAKLLKLIDSGEFPPGARLPGERDLAERFGVSRVTVREAEIALDAQQRIEIKPGSGVYVRKRPVDVPNAFPDVSAFELTSARAVIESEAAALAASRASDAEIAELEALITAMCDPRASDDTAGQADRQFHLALARMTGNAGVEYCIRQLWRMRAELPGVREVYARVCHDDGGSRNDEHMAIVAALKKHDPAAARTAMRYHFQRLFESMLEATESEALAEVRRRFQQDREHFLAATQI